MLKNKPFLFAVLYSLLVIAVKLIILLGGFAITNFGFKWSQFLTVLMIIPFIWLTIKSVRAQQGGYIGGKVALKKGLQMTVIAIAMISVYNYFEFDAWKEIASQYYNSDLYHHFLENKKEIKPEQYAEIIKVQVESFRLISPFQYLTIKLIPCLIFGISSSFIFAMFMKRNPPFSLN